MAKRRRSAKQKANDRRLGAMARARGKSSTPKRRKRRSTRNTIKRVVRRSPMARRRRSPARRSSSSKGVLGKIPLINNPMFKKAAAGIGVATLGALALSFIAPSIASNPIVRPVLALAGGGPIGAVAQVLSTGGIGSITSALGGANQNAGSAFTGGFA